jgi:hypothetical protein
LEDSYTAAPPPGAPTPDDVVLRTAPAGAAALPAASSPGSPSPARLRPAATAAASASGGGGRGAAFAGALSVVVDAYTANTPTPYSVVTAAATPMTAGSSTRFASSIVA